MMIPNFCLFPSYKNALGEPGKGVHSARFLGMARNDIVVTGVLATIYTILFSRPKNGLEIVTKSIKCGLVFWLIGTCLHLLFCVETPVTNLVNKI